MSPWIWFALAAVLVTVEMVVGSGALLWIAGAAAATAIVALAIDLGWSAQAACFAVLGVVAVLAFRRYRGLGRGSRGEQDASVVNIGADRHIGRIYTVETAIADGTGRVHAGDTVWTARGPDAPTGAKVRVVGVEDGILTVTPA